MKNILLVGLGGALGSILRYLVSLWTTKEATQHFPWATFIINVSGCLAIGLLMGLLDKQILSNATRLLLITGFCGGFTTFSTFSAENIKLIQSGHLFTALLYIILSIILGLAAVWGGLFLTKAI
ncbi:fluoride efflux transporter CrcB [Taibaiella sp. KBW10]|uniref:fluoride efflux transporter CrcB n=1 Tax=Taibaiella sp. KBW10 TaxID=2153357 RepID=UPI000F5AFD8B|nr:fluoride efflux transporter CrcB [Taibaiella sp. KBW10]RQO29918.1 fluoride efflux transporter CrcB [Taibaiella sp. KBW10]